MALSDLELREGAQAPRGPDAVVRARAHEAAAAHAIEGVVFRYVFAATPVRQAEATVSLPLNTVVDRYTLKMVAKPAVSGAAFALAQLSIDPADSARPTERVVVLDFGQPLTVSRLTVPGALKIGFLEVKAWNGSQFSGYVFYESTTPPASAQLDTQVRTQRLRIRFRFDSAVGFPTEVALADKMTVHYADSPGDLRLTLDDGPPVFREAGPVSPSSKTTVSEIEWSSTFARHVDVTAALQAVTGDPLAGEEAHDFHFKLESSAAGLLSLGPQASSLRRRRRVRFAGETQTDLHFAEEGRQTLALALPAAASRTVQGVHLTVSGEAPAERVVPATGPALAHDAVLILDPDRAVCQRLTDLELTALTGVRVPVVAGPQGAELRVVLWADAGGRPGEALERGATDPLTLEPGPPLDTEDVPTKAAWTTLRFPKPVPLDAGALPWAALIVSRGQLAWTLTAAAGAATFRGPPAGPWLALPPLFSAGGDLAGHGPRLRQMGTAAEDAVPLLWLRLQAGVGTEVTPTAKGLAVSFSPNAALIAPTLRVDCRGAATLTLRDIDLVTKEG